MKILNLKTILINMVGWWVISTVITRPESYPKLLLTVIIVLIGVELIKHKE